MLKLIIESYPEDGIAEIYFSFRDSYFPEEHWTDFKKVLSVWRSALFEDGSDGVLFFMDGPFHFDVQKVNREAYLFTFYNEQKDGLEPVTKHVATKAEYEALTRQLADIASSQ